MGTFFHQITIFRTTVCNVKTYICTFFSCSFFVEDLSVLSEDVASLISPDERFDSPGNEWFPQSQTSIQQDLNQDYGQELISKGPAKAEVQLR